MQSETRAAPAAARPLTLIVIESLESRQMMSATDFAVVALPDTQVYAWKYPAIFKDQTKWVAANQASQDIQFVTHVGDIVQHGYGRSTTNAEWSNARSAMKTIEDANVPFGIVPGNHDVLESGASGQRVDTRNYLSNFGPKRYAGRSWFGGSSPSGLSTYQFFGPRGGMRFLHLSLGIETPHAELAWAQGVINANRNRPVMVTTHKYFARSESRVGLPSDIQLFNPQGLKAVELLRHFVSANRNIFLVISGHYSGEYRAVDTNVAGLPVHSITADYQSETNGGNGYLRVMRFNTAANRIDVTTYSPTLGTFRTGRASQFSLPVDFKAYTATNPTLTFRNGVSGYAATQDTYLAEGAPTKSYGTSDTLKVDDDIANVSTRDDRGHGLIRFDNLVGTGAGRIPRGATITRATLTITISNDIDDARNPNFDVHMVGKAWSETSTWNSMRSGLSVGDDLTAAFTTFAGSDTPEGENVRRIDIRAAVQAWVNGTPNYGLALMPQIIKGNDDGIRIYSSEAAQTMFRPVLEVEYRPAVRQATVQAATMLAVRTPQREPAKTPGAWQVSASELVTLAGGAR
jgi:hypothetical protein